MSDAALTAGPDGVLTLPVAGVNHLATLQTGITYCDVPNGFARAHLAMDLIKPVSDKPTPVIVFVSGNGWRSIDRACHVPTLSAFAQAGYLVASIDYRISGEAFFPEPLKDVKAAIRFLRANAQRYNLDPARIGIWGNSAGGQLSGMAATTGDAPEFNNVQWPGHSSAVQAAALWYPPTDLTALPQGGLVETMHMGVFVKDPAHAAAVSRADPSQYIGPDSPPVLLVHGTRDAVVPIAHSERLHAALRAAGRPSTFIRVEGAEHSFGQVSSTPAVMAAMRAFFDQHLKPH